MFVAPCLVNVANADILVSENPSFTFGIVGAQNNDLKKLWDYFQIKISKRTNSETGEVVGAQFKFDLTDDGYEAGLAGGEDKVKPKDVAIAGDWLTEFFKSGDLKWSHNDWTPSYLNLDFKSNNISWDDFALAASEESNTMTIHIQSIYVDEKNTKASINDAKFSNVKENAPPYVTPEPATMLIFGLGIAGIGLCRRMRKV